MVDWLRRLAGIAPADGKDANAVRPVRLADAIADARLLLHYAASRGIELPDGVADAVIEADHAQGPGGKAVGGEAARGGTAADKVVPPDVELAFWTAFRQLAVAVSPVTVHSIRATVDTHPSLASPLLLRISGKAVSDARWSVFKYRWLALFFLIALISVQMFWVVGVSLTGDTVSLTERIAALEVESRALVADPDNDADVQRVIQEDGRLQAEMTELRGWLTGSYQSLRDWNRTWAYFVFYVPFLTSPFDSPGFAQLQPEAQNRIEVTSAEFVLQALAAYVLPLLYGLLGAFAYVLRDIAREVRDVTFSADSTIRYGLRLSLGLLSGIAVGLLLTPGSGENGNAVPSEVLDLKTLSPLGLAFVAGYAVELIFAAMDRIVTAFTGDRTIGARDRSARGGKDEKGGAGA